jgi:lipid A 3-O-deacylase
MNSKFIKSFGIISLLFISLVSTARSEGFTFSVGKFDHSDDRTNAGMFQLDYDFDKTLFGSPIGDFKPVIGFLVTDDNAKYGYAGVRLDYKLANNSILISPSFTPGVFGKGDGKDLGHNIEFKTQVRAALNLSSTSNIGISYSHISNASLGDKNPGANNYSISFQKNF